MTEDLTLSEIIERLSRIEKLLKTMVDQRSHELVCWCKNKDNVDLYDY